jgi:5-formyltetrahydrofolate cyclo-ligase
MLKHELRKVFLSKRLLLTKDEIELNSIKIIKSLTEKFNVLNKNICTFFPISNKKEINTFLFFDFIQKFDFNLFTTKWNRKTNELTVHKINFKEDLILNEYQIPEPKDTISCEINYENLNFIIIPLLCFDKQGNRVGYGKGIYDKFLSKLDNSKSIFIGVSLLDPVDLIYDTNEFDIKLDYCITPEKIYHFEK